jgi:hypothetical protein
VCESLSLHNHVLLLQQLSAYPGGVNRVTRVHASLRIAPSTVRATD